LKLTVNITSRRAEVGEKVFLKRSGDTEEYLDNGLVREKKVSGGIDFGAIIGIHKQNSGKEKKISE